MQHIEDYSQDDTDPSPEPTPRGPPPRQYPFMMMPTTPAANTTSATADSMLEQTLFSDSMEELQGDDDGDEFHSIVDQVSVTQPVVPPSPLSPPPSSIMGESANATINSSLHHDSRRRRQIRTRRTSAVSAASTSRENRRQIQPPPVPEVVVDQDDETLIDEESLDHHHQQQQQERSRQFNLNVDTSFGQPNLAARRPASTSPQKSQTSSKQKSVSRGSSSLKGSDQKSQSQSRNPSSDDVARVHGTALQALLKLKEELVMTQTELQKVKESNSTLEQHRNTLAEHCQQKDTELQAERSDLRRQLAEQEEVNGLLRTRNADLTKERKEIEIKSRTASREKKDYMHKRLAWDNRQRELKAEIESLRKELIDAVSDRDGEQETIDQLREEKAALEEKNKDLERTLEQREKHDHNVQLTQEENEARYQSVVEEKESLKKELDEVKAASNANSQQYEAENQAFTQQISELESQHNTLIKIMKDDAEQYKQETSKLKKEVEESRLESKTLRSGLSPRVSSRSSMRSPGRRSTPGSSLRFRSDESASPGTNLDASIADRLARIRDSAERATLVRQQKHDIARLRKDYESKIQKMISDHQEETRLNNKRASTNLESSLREIQGRLQQEFDDRMQEATAQHEKELSKFKEESSRGLEKSEEEFHGLMTKMATTMHQYEREAAHREALEKSVDELKDRIRFETNLLTKEHAADVQRLRGEWEEERTTLLTVVKQECNTVFDGRIQRFGAAPKNSFAMNGHGVTTPSRPSPRSPPSMRSTSDRVSRSNVFFSDDIPTRQDDVRLTIDTIEVEDISPIRDSSRRKSTGNESAVISPTVSDLNSLEAFVESLF